MARLIIIILGFIILVSTLSSQVSERQYLFQALYQQGVDSDFKPRFGVDSQHVFCAASSNLTYTTRDLRTWNCPEILPLRTALLECQWTVADTYIACTVYDKYPWEECSTFIYDKDLNLLRSSTPLSGIKNEAKQVTYNFGDTLVAVGGNGVTISIDAAKTWSNVKQARIPQVPYAILKMRSGALASVTDDSVMATSDAGRSWQRDVRFQSQTRWFHEWNDSLLISCVQSSGPQYGGLYAKRDTGLTWQRLDTIRFVNSSRVVTSGEFNGQVLWYAVRGNQLTILLDDGNVLTTTDTMRTWIDRGNVGSQIRGGRGVTITHDDCGLVATAKGLWRIPLQELRAVELFSNVMPFGDAFQLDDSTYLASSHVSLLQTTDGGKRWLTTEVATPGRIIAEAPFYMFVGQLSTVSAADNQSVTVSNARYRALYNARSGDSIWQLFNLDLLSNVPNPEYTEYVAGRSVWNTRGGMYAVTSRPLKLLRSLDNGRTLDTVAVVPGAGRHLRYVEAFDSTVFAVADSVFSWKNGTWTNVGVGLPTDSLGVQRVQSLVYTLDGDLLAGLGGTRHIDSNNVATDYAVPGSGEVLMGTEWSRVANVSEHDVHIMDLHVTQIGTILATMSIVSKEASVATRRQDDNIIVRSADNGRTWQEVYHDIYGGPALLNPLLFAENTFGTLYASRTRGGLISSNNDGETWHDVEGWVSVARINDMTVDTNGVLYVATDSALITVKPTATNITSDEVSTYLHLAAFPNPAKNRVTITVDNPSKAGEVESLVAIGTLGQASMDLTNQLQQQASAKQAKLSVDTSALPIGTYVLALRVGNQTREIVLCITR